MPAMWVLVASLTTVLLLVILAARHVSRKGAGVICALLFSTTPMIWHGVSDGAAQMVLVPFVPAWLFAVDQYARSGRLTWLAVAGAILAQMAYLHSAGIAMAPVLAGITALALMARRDRLVALLALAAGLAAVASPLLIAWWRDPGMLVRVVNVYGLYDADRFNLLQGAREITRWMGLSVRAEVYWDCFNPALLFLDRVFLLTLAVPLIRGLAAYATHPRGMMDWLVLAGFVASPAAAALIAQPPQPARLLLMAPFAAIIATRGCYPGAFNTSAADVPAASVMSATNR